MAPEIMAAIPNAMVNGKRSWFGLVRPRIWMNGRATGSWNMCAGEVITARNGITAPILSISANEAIIIRMSSMANCARRREVI